MLIDYQYQFLSLVRSLITSLMCMFSKAANTLSLSLTYLSISCFVSCLPSWTRMSNLPYLMEESIITGSEAHVTYDSSLSSLIWNNWPIPISCWSLNLILKAIVRAKWQFGTVGTHVIWAWAISFGNSLSLPFCTC